MYKEKMKIQIMNLNFFLIKLLSKYNDIFRLSIAIAGKNVVLTTTCFELYALYWSEIDQ